MLSVKIALGISAAAHVYEGVEAVRSYRAFKKLHKQLEATSKMNLYLLKLVQESGIPLSEFDAIALTEISDEISKS